MNSMTYKFLIQKILNEHNKPFDDNFRKELYNKYKILSKDYLETGLVLLYSNYDEKKMSDLERETRSVVINKKTLELVAYSCPFPFIDEKIDLTKKNLISKCYEGTFLSIFYFNGKWYVSTRKCLDSDESIFNPEEKKEPKSHYEMFNDVFHNTEYKSFEGFSKTLDTKKSYYFVLVHCDNQHIIDYTKEFGKDYKKLGLLSIRDENMNELEDEVKSFKVGNNIFVPESYDTLNIFNELDRDFKPDSISNCEGVICEGIIVKSENKLVKLQTKSYQFSTICNGGNRQSKNENVLKGYIWLYQEGLLKNNTFELNNPFKPEEKFNIVDVINSTFKTCASELFELFKKVWYIQTGRNNNEELYKILPKEYKDVMFAIKGIYFKKKALKYTNPEEKNSYLTISDIYNHLKSLSVEFFVSFLLVRKQMFSSISEKKTNELFEFGKITTWCKPYDLKLCAILTNKLLNKEEQYTISLE